MFQASAFGWPFPHRPGPPPSAACPFPTSAPEHAQPSLKSKSSRTLHRSVSGYTPFWVKQSAEYVCLPDTVDPRGPKR